MVVNNKKKHKRKKIKKIILETISYEFFALTHFFFFLPQ